MRDKTFEILAKWACGKLGVQIEFKQGLHGALAIPSKNTIQLPTSIKGSNPYAATAVTVHEAGHIKSTNNKLCDEVCKSKEDKEIHNVIEDIRIDRDSFSLLNNMREFFRELYTSTMPAKEIFNSPNNDPVRQAMMRCILKLEGMGSDLYTQIPKVKDVDYVALEAALEEGTYGLSCDNASLTRKAIKKIKMILKIKDEPKEEEDKKPKSKESSKEGKKEKNDVIKGKPGGKGWSKEHVLQSDGKGSAIEIKPHSLLTQTRQRFCELLKETFKRTLPRGNQLNTKKLISFLTGDVDSLFKNEAKRKRYNSKILFLLDESGSMNEVLIDGAHKWRTMCEILKPILEMINKLREAEGLAIDFEVWTFDYKIIKKYNADNIHTLFDAKPRGGTNICGTFCDAQNHLLSDQSLNGKKLIVLATDGAVKKSEIDSVKKEILRFNEDIRCLLIGIGAEQYSAGELLKHNIVGAAVAEDVILQAITELL